MFKRTGFALTLLAAVSLLSVTAADAGDRRERHRIHKHDGIHLNDRSAHRGDWRGNRRFDRRQKIVIKVDIDRSNRHRRHHRHDREVDTYSGDVDIYSRPGVGTWSYGVMPTDDAIIINAPTVKIIDVGTLKPNAACEMQAGVCVIRP
jgi:hypothetical protein